MSKMCKVDGCTFQALSNKDMCYDHELEVERGIRAANDATFSRVHDKPVKQADMVNHPPHYTSHPSGVECITVVEHFNFCRGNAMKYMWRAGEKGGPEQELEDLKKARWYLDREIQRMEKSRA